MTASGDVGDNPFPLEMTTIPLTGVAHLQGIGDVGLVNDMFVGTQGLNRRLEGLQIDINPPIPGLGLVYTAHVQDEGDVRDDQGTVATFDDPTTWANGGTFVGSRGKSRRLEGFAIQLTGDRAGEFSVMYMAHLHDYGDTPFFRDGQFCGTRGQQRGMEGVLVHVASLR